MGFYQKFKLVFRAKLIYGKETDDTKDEEVPLRHAPPFYGNTFIKYDNKKFIAELNVIYNGEVSSNKMAPSEQAKPTIYSKDKEGKPYSPSWYTLNAKVSYRFNRPFTFNTGIENIANKRYRPYSSGIVAPGANFIASLRVIM